MSELTPYYRRGEDISYYFTGQFSDYTWSEEGEFKFRVSALRIFGNRSVSKDYVGETGSFVLKYGNYTVP